MKYNEQFNLASRHKNFEKQVFEKLLTQDTSLINSISTDEARKVYNWNRQVVGCYQRSREFVRLKISQYGILYGKIEPEHFVEDLVVKWFSGRFPMFVIMLESERGTFIINKEKQMEFHKEKISELLTRFEKALPKNEILSELEDFNDDQYWKKYYSSQFIKERKNRKYFQKNIPRKFHNWDGLNLEKERFEGNKKLIEF